MKIIAIILLVISIPAAACVCRGDWSLESAVAGAEHVAIAQIESSRSIVHEEEDICMDAAAPAGAEPEACTSVEHITIYRAAVQEVLRGAPTKFVDVQMTMSDCSAPLSVGSTYLLLWNGESAFSSYCAPQVILSSVPAALLDKLRSEP